MNDDGQYDDSKPWGDPTYITNSANQSLGQVEDLSTRPFEERFSLALQRGVSELIKLLENNYDQDVRNRIIEAINSINKREL